MGDSVIMLASKYNPKKQVFPAHVTEKYDGVAADFYKERDGWKVRSRQNKPINSVQHIINALNKGYPDARTGLHLIGELYVEGMDFKDLSGLVRRNEPAPQLKLYAYDCYSEGAENASFADRLYLGVNSMLELVGDPIVVPGYYRAETAEDVEEIKRKVIAKNPEAEGIMIRQLYGPASTYQVGKRPAGMAKYKLVETLDLEIHSIEEAVDKNGELKGMLGRLNVIYKGNVIGCGPGKLTHPERIDLFVNRDNYIGKTVEIAYMPDASYDALREPRVIRLRPDKD